MTAAHFTAADLIAIYAAEGVKVDAGFVLNAVIDANRNIELGGRAYAEMEAKAWAIALSREIARMDRDYAATARAARA